MKHKDINYNFELFKPKDGDVIENCNMSQKKAHTVLFAGIENLTFKSCNCQNVEKGPKWIFDDCLAFHADVIEPVDEPYDEVAEFIAEKGVDAILEKIGKTAIDKFSIKELPMKEII